MSTSPFSGLHTVAIAHLALAVVSALLSPHLPGGRTLSMVVWGLGGLAAFAFVGWRSARAWHLFSPLRRLLASICLALAVSAVSLLVSFVVLVEVWEWQGYGH